MKAYHVKVYLTSKGLKTEKKEVSVKKEKDGFYTKVEKNELGGWGSCQFNLVTHIWEDTKIKIGTVRINPNHFTKIFDKTIIAESWCLQKDYRETRLSLIESYKSYISLIKKNILEKEKEIRNEKRKLINYKKGLNIFLKSIKTSKSIKKQNK